MPRTRSLLVLSLLVAACSSSSSPPAPAKAEGGADPAAKAEPDVAPGLLDPDAATAEAPAEYKVEVTDDLWDLYVALQSDLLANEVTATDEGDPRAAAALARPLHSEMSVSRGRRAVLVHRTKRSQHLRGAGWGIAQHLRRRLHRHVRGFALRGPPGPDGSRGRGAPRAR